MTVGHRSKRMPRTLGIKGPPIEETNNSAGLWHKPICKRYEAYLKMPVPSKQEEQEEKGCRHGRLKIR